MEIVEVLPTLHLIRLEFGAAHLWHDEDGLALIDTGVAGSAPALEEAIRKLGLDPADLRHIVLTHWHPDHTGSAAELARRWPATVLAHRLDAPVIRGEEAGAPPVLLDFEQAIIATLPPIPSAPPVPDVVEVADGDVLGFGGGAVVVAVPGHTDGSIAIRLPRHGVLFTGDAVADVDGRTMLGVFNTDRAQAVESFHRLAALDVETVVFGHGDPVVGGASAVLRAATGQHVAGWRSPPAGQGIGRDVGRGRARSPSAGRMWTAWKLPSMRRVRLSEPSRSRTSRTRAAAWRRVRKYSKASAWSAPSGSSRSELHRAARASERCWNRAGLVTSSISTMTAPSAVPFMRRSRRCC